MTPAETNAFMLERRALLRLAAHGVGGLLVGVAVGHGCSRDAPKLRIQSKLDLSEVLSAYFRRGFSAVDAEATPLDDAALLGEFFVRSSAGAADELTAGLEDCVRVFSEAETIAAALAALDDSLARDFSDMRLASVSGWQLGETEAYLCTLAYRQRGAAPQPR